MSPFTDGTTTSERYPGEEPLPGYRLIEPLGKGGFGEVWKCVVPGGLHKAIKFVVGGGEECRRELAAFEQIKTIRHPFLLTLERVELADSGLIMVMELADCQLHDRFRQCQAEGLPGIPRPELIGYLEEAAEALDMIAAKYGLQHLDVKPQNLFLVSEHVKVGDYGLVRRMEQAQGDNHSGFTPRYTAPEVFLGGVDARSDQYSLALVYMELLTGAFPYRGKSTQQLILQHVSGAPDLSALPAADQPAVERALAKEPASRFETCAAFVRALANPVTAPAVAAPPAAQAQPAQQSTGSRLVRPTEGDSDQQATPSPRTAPTLVTLKPPRPASTRQARVRAEEAPPPDPFARFLPVMPVARLRDVTPLANPPDIGSAKFVAAVVGAAEMASPLGPDEMQPDGTHKCRLLSTMPAAMVPYKLVIVAERYGLAAQQRDPSTIAMWRESMPQPRKPGSVWAEPAPLKVGFEIVIQVPTPPAVEITVTGSFRGSPDEEFKRKAEQDIPAIMGEIRGILQNVDERRAHPRYPVDFPVRVFPLYSDGVIGPPIDGRCQDLAVGGVRFVTPEPVPAGRIFVEFPGVRDVAGFAIYVRVLRAGLGPDGKGVSTVGRFPIRGGSGGSSTS